MNNYSNNYILQSQSALLIADIFFEKGINEYNNSNYVKAIDYINISFKIYEIQNITDKNSQCYNVMSQIYFSISDIYKAFEYNLKFLRINQQAGNICEFDAFYINMGNLSIKIQNYHYALIFYKKALYYAELCNDIKSKALILSNIANVYYFNGNYSKSIEYSEQAIDVYEKTSDSLSVASCLINIGSALVENKKSNEAFEYFNKSLTLSYTLKSNYLICVNLLNISNINYENAKYNTVIDSLKKCLEISKKYNINDFYVEIFDILSNSYAKINDYKKAFINLNKFKIIKDSIYNATSVKSISGLEAKFLNEKKIKKLNNKI